MANLFSGQPRGRTLPGARSIAEYIWDDPGQKRAAYDLDREEFGLQEINGRLTGFSNWIDIALAARVGKRRARRPRKAPAAETASTT
jgi:hypothetical protein